MIECMYVEFSCTEYQQKRFNECILFGENETRNGSKIFGHMSDDVIQVMLLSMLRQTLENTIGIETTRVGRLFKYEFFFVWSLYKHQIENANNQEFLEKELPVRMNDCIESYLTGLEYCVNLRKGNKL